MLDKFRKRLKQTGDFAVIDSRIEELKSEIGSSSAGVTRKLSDIQRLLRQSKSFGMYRKKL